MKKLLTPLLIISLLVLLQGCASPAQIGGMIEEKSRSVSNAPQQLRSNILVQSVTGGESTNPLWTSEIGSKEYQVALEQSLANAGLLGVTQNDNKYQLAVSMLQVDQPLVGFNLTVTAKVQYTLKETNSGSIVYSRFIIRPYTAVLSETIFLQKRLRKANEGAARENIKAFIDQLYSLNLTD